MDKNIVNRAIEKHGGALPMHLKDERGKTLYDNRDAMAMAERYVKTGGATTHNQKLDLSQDDWIREHWYEDFICKQCKTKHKSYFSYDEWRCTLCWTDNPPTVRDDEIKKNAIKYIDESLKFHINDKSSVQEVINRYIREVLDGSGKNL